MAERAREQVTCFRKCLNNNKHFSRTGTEELPFPCGRAAVETSLLANLPPVKNPNVAWLSQRQGPQMLLESGILWEIMFSTLVSQRGDYLR